MTHTWEKLMLSYFVQEKMKRKAEEISQYVSNIRSLTYQNLDENFRIDVISKELGVNKNSLQAKRYQNTSGNWYWIYYYKDYEFKSIKDLVSYICNEGLELLAEASYTQQPSTTYRNIFTSFAGFLKIKNTMPSTEQELLDMLREFACTLWMSYGSIDDIKKYYATFKTLYLKECFESFIKS